MIVSTTITDNRADVIGAALKAIAPEVDVCIVIDTGVTDNTIELARAAVGSKLHVVKWPWQNDFAAARNFALEYARDWLRMRPDAARAGADDPRDWIIQADTDEWLRLPGLRDTLDGLPAEVEAVLVPHASRTYKQARCIRATCRGTWKMPVHEYFSPYTAANAPEPWCFECQPRPTEDRTAKYERYRQILEGLTAAEPENARAWYYLGDTLVILGYKGAAIEAFTRCWSLPGWNDQAGWACYRKAILQMELGLLDLAIRTCADGIGRSPLTAELYWLAGHFHFQQKEWVSAYQFASAAVKIGPRNQPGFCYPPGQKDLPEKLMRAAAEMIRAPKPAASPPAEEPAKSVPRGVDSPPAAG
jgi:glycosyltransferase involved in cell wall biosynthesis